MTKTLTLVLEAPLPATDQQVGERLLAASPSSEALRGRLGAIATFAQAGQPMDAAGVSDEAPSLVEAVREHCRQFGEAAGLDLCNHALAAFRAEELDCAARVAAEYRRHRALVLQAKKACRELRKLAEMCAQAAEAGSVFSRDANLRLRESADTMATALGLEVLDRGDDCSVDDRSELPLQHLARYLVERGHSKQSVARALAKQVRQIRAWCNPPGE